MYGNPVTEGRQPPPRPSDDYVLRHLLQQAPARNQHRSQPSHGDTNDSTDRKVYGRATESTADALQLTSTRSLIARVEWQIQADPVVVWED